MAAPDAEPPDRLRHRRHRRCACGRGPDSGPVRLHRPGSISVRSHVHLAEGVELQIDPEAARLTPEEVRELARLVSHATERLLSCKDKEGKDKGPG